MFMTKSRFHIFDLFGIPIYVDVSLIILLLFFVGGGAGIYIGLLCAMMLLVSITAHELGHALTARAFGYQTHDITLSLLGGCASIIALPRKAYQEFLTAIAGPAVSFLLSLAGAAVIAAVSDNSFGNISLHVLVDTLSSFGLPVELTDPIFADSEWHFFIRMMGYLAVMNLMLGVFNLLPGFPLDGGRVFRSFMRAFMPRAKATYIAMVVGRVVAVLIAIRGAWNVINGGAWGFVTLLIAWMIWKEGCREYLLAQMESDWEYQDFRARVSPPPYGGDGDECDVTRG